MEGITETQEEVVEAPEEQNFDIADIDHDVESEEHSDKSVPLSAVIKERRKRQEAEQRSQRAEIELQYLREQSSKGQPKQEEEDDSEYEATTRADLKRSAEEVKRDTKRDIVEELWRDANPEKAREVDEKLAQFLKQRPNLASAINESKNRYAEAYTLMSALSPRQQQALSQKPEKKAAPGNPSGIPKAASINQAVDVMSMSDEEYRSWRQSFRKR